MTLTNKPRAAQIVNPAIDIATSVEITKNSSAGDNGDEVIRRTYSRAKKAIMKETEEPNKSFAMVLRFCPNSVLFL